MAAFYFFVGGSVLGWAIGFSHGLDVNRQQGRRRR